jgi:2-keto-4-pentenoate hydratase
MAKDELRRMALCMLADYDARTPGELFSRPVDLTIPQSYQLQNEIARLREERGEKIIGYKVGCTSKAIQEQLGVGEPIFGRIFDSGCFRSGSRLSYRHFANLAIEGELAVLLGKDLSGMAVSKQACQEAIEAVFPVIELHHYVLHGASPPGPQLITGSGMHAGFVLADVQPRYSGLVNIPCSLSIRIDDAVVGTHPVSARMVVPIRSLRWLAGRLARFGLQLWKGQVILTGSPMNLYPVGPGSRIVVEAGPLGASCVEIDP